MLPQETTAAAHSPYNNKLRLHLHPAAKTVVNRAAEAQSLPSPRNSNARNRSLLLLPLHLFRPHLLRLRNSRVRALSHPCF